MSADPPPVLVPPARRQVIVDTDTGLDDALALLHLAGSPHADVAAVTTVYGNCVVQDSARNAAHVLRLAGLADVPLSLGAAGPLEGEAHIAGYVHGGDGLGDLGLDRPDPEVTQRTSAEQLVHLANSAPGRYDLLALGPLTNVALALRLDPLLLTKLRSVVVMGGSGPYRPLGEVLMVDANVQNDPAAARELLAAPRPAADTLTLVGVDVTATVVLDEAMVESLRRAGTAWGDFAAATLDAYADFYAHEWGRRVSPVHDGLAAGVLARPELVTATVSGPGAVMSNGFATRARVLRLPDGTPPAVRPEHPPMPALTAVTAVDRAAFLADFVTSLAEGVRR
ncbi:nucleoside hydrolase [Kineococcus rubinsiae]|uniref:nucleoside hydrolase n=1 Tax=Kineococcus rubinsiae TaxID=2609562 RepID=UPI001430FAD9|nr:nucleoside hydrolase [Kineococcus rubinsiae]NIZ91221.1 nucleoside hydrolase [Kineococcus rubinsiae]